MDSVRFLAQDSFYALVATYLKQGTRDILGSDYLSWTPDQRSIQLDGTTFNIVHRLAGEPHEVPGVNVVFYQEAPVAGYLRFTRLAIIHLFIPVSITPLADDRTLTQLQRLVDEALYTRGMPLLDLYSTTPVALPTNQLWWELLNPAEGWQELTDLANSSYLHRSKNLRLVYNDRIMT